jgi:hypothetical protein|tara:strand:- start:4890 stop:5060 length:171 start_codon:yes stop_codon:yes gene_type:complete
MTRLQKLKREHIKNVNKLLDEGHKKENITKKEVKLNPSDNVSAASKEFIDKMKGLF